MGEEKQDERRFRSLCIPEMTIIDIVRPRPKDRLRIDWSASGLPEDVRIHHVWHDPQRAGFVFILEHESFDPVPPGDCIPSADMHAVMVRERIEELAAAMVSDGN